MTRTDWSSITKRLVIVGLVVLLLVGLWLFRAILPPLALAVVLAYLLKPLADFLQQRTRLPRLAAVLLVFAALVVILSLIPFTVVPYAVGQLGRLTGFFQGLVDDLSAFLSRSIVILGFRFRPQDLVGDVPAALQGLFRPFATQGLSLLFGVATSLVWVLAILVIAFYLVKDAAQLRAFLDRVAPPGYGEELGRLREEISGVWSAFFRGQVVLCIIIGLAVWLAMTVVGLPSAGLMGLTAGILEVIPNFGPILSTIPALFIAFYRGSTYLPLSNFWFTVLVLLVYIGIQQAENAFLVPRIMGRRMRVHPVIVFIGVLAGGYLAGALGVLLAAPILGTLRVLTRYTYAKLLDRDPYPAPVLKPRAEFYAGEVDAILLDLDGTLVETDDQAVESLARRLQPLRRLLPKHDPVRTARHLLMAFEGPGTRFLGLLDRVGLDDNVLGLGDRLRRLRGMYPMPSFHAVDGVGPVLHELNRRYRLGIVTTRSHEEVKAFLAQQGWTDLFQVITGRDDTWRIKPDPSPIQHTAALMGVPVERCLVVGDTTADIRAAGAAGALSAAVLCGFGEREELERAGANRVLTTTSELAEWL